MYPFRHFFQKHLLVVLFSLGVFCLYGQQTDSLSFIQYLEGVWVGDLEIYQPTGKVQTLPMEFHLLPMDTSERHTYTIIYGEDKEAGRRSYELVTIDSTKGYYAIDEKNSIRIEAFLLGNQLVQRFEVMGNLLLSTIEKIDQQTLLWTILSGGTTPISNTGNQRYEGLDIPKVTSYPIGTLQRAVLKRKP